ncbi:MAG: alkaline phosphatase family protein [Candidatus Cybelea sp.]
MKTFWSQCSAALTAFAFVLSGCASVSQPLPYMQGGTALRVLDATGAGKITHIVYIVQENRSFNDMFYGYPGALTVKTGKISTGQTVKLRPVPLSDQYVIDHSLDAFIAACNGTGSLPGSDCRNNGFNNEANGGGPVKYPEYVYVPRSDSQPYFDMAHEGALADHMFQSQLDESFVAHQYIIAAQANWSVDLPSGSWGCPVKNSQVAWITKQRTIGGYQSACFDYQTLGDELDKAKLSWRFYATKYGGGSHDGAVWSSYQAVKHIYYGPDWKNVITPNWKFLKDVKAGKLANFTWITPVCDDSDHVNCPGGYGPSWVSALVNAVGESKFWDSTAIFIQWDDWGGLYDPVPPPLEDRDSLGMRVPLVMLSPYAKHGFVCHDQYETASVIKFAENLWGLGHLVTPADRRALSPADECFDFTQSPAKYVKIKAPLPPKFFMRQYTSDYFAPDYE